MWEELDYSIMKAKWVSSMCQGYRMARESRSWRASMNEVNAITIIASLRVCELLQLG